MALWAFTRQDRFFKMKYHKSNMLAAYFLTIYLTGTKKNKPYTAFTSTSHRRYLFRTILGLIYANYLQMIKVTQHTLWRSKWGLRRMIKQEWGIQEAINCHCHLLYIQSRSDLVSKQKKRRRTRRGRRRNFPFYDLILELFFNLEYTITFLP